MHAKDQGLVMQLRIAMGIVARDRENGLSMCLSGLCWPVTDQTLPDMQQCYTAEPLTTHKCTIDKTRQHKYTIEKHTVKYICE